MSIKWKAILPSLFGTLSAVGGVAANGKIAALNSAAQTAVKAAVTKVDGGIDKLVAAYNTFETNNEVVAEAITGTVGVLKGLGLTVPDISTVEIHVKAAIADLAGILVPVTSTATTATTAATTDQTTTSAS
ncbi:hypothetical protein LWC05_16845 [Acetobacter sicerae]|uniref:Uncharacterized protein n=1 Tax=Acetobacter sicerae TaxID=85325 RepID=A0ABS8W057_9PROT|nr:hypothetical protein [Acetobacter sicerae]MCE0745539.1 hypothetical protein [Acetobacter sicerae]